MTDDERGLIHQLLDLHGQIEEHKLKEIEAMRAGNQSLQAMIGLMREMRQILARLLETPSDV